MWRQLLVVTALLVLSKAEDMVPGNKVGEGAKSRGYKTIYGNVDEEVMMLNEINDKEDDVLKKKSSVKDSVKQLPARDVKCFMSDDYPCSIKMLNIKSVIVQAIQDDCSKCSMDEKLEAGKVIISLMAHNPMAWKLFLTRHGSENYSKFGTTLSTK